MSTRFDEALFQDGLRFVHYFNGRLLTALDLSDERDANRKEHRQLGLGCGDGVVYGLEAKATPSGEISVAPGLAVTRLGRPLYTNTSYQLTLEIKPPAPAAAGSSGFQECQPAQKTVYAATDGVYLLVIAPAAGTAGKAPASSLEGEVAPCNIGRDLEGVQFRLVPLLTTAQFGSATRARNLLAWKCFGLDGLQPNPFDQQQPLSYGLLDDQRGRTLTDCDVPLAVLQIGAGPKLRFVDTWSVRRRLTRLPSAAPWDAVIGDRRRAEAEARFLQFQEQLSSILAETGATPSAVKAEERFRYLPPAGYLPVGGAKFDWPRFLGKLNPRAPIQTDRGLLRGILRRSLDHDSIDLDATPPVPVDVYQDPDLGGFVLFARSVLARIQVNASPASSQATVESVSTGEKTKCGNGSADVVAGDYSVEVSAAGYVTKTGTARAVAGRTTLVSITLSAVPQEERTGSITIKPSVRRTSRLMDQGEILERISGSVVARARGRRTNVSKDGAQRGLVWIINKLPKDTYDVTFAATGFKTWTTTQTLDAGEDVTLTAALEPEDTSKPPKPCRELEVGSTGPATIRGTKIRLCMVPKLRQPYERWKPDDWVRVPIPKPREDVWVAGWREILGGDPVIDPEIYIDPIYTRPRTDRDVPEAPQAWFVAGDFVAPMLLTPEDGRTRLSVPLSAERVKGLGEDDIAALNDFGVYTLDQLASAWTGLIETATGVESAGFARSLVLDGARAVVDTNAGHQYYAGVDRATSDLLEKDGYKDDVSIANAGLDRLERTLEPAVGKERAGGFAIRLIEQARRIVGKETWSLEQLGFSGGQIEELATLGVESMGVFAERAATEEGRTAIAAGVTLTQAEGPQKIAFVNSMREAALTTVTSASVVKAGGNTLLTLSNVNEVVAGRLAGAGFQKVESLAAQDAKALAASTGLTESQSRTLIEEAKTRSAGAQPVAMLATITPEIASALERGGIGTVAGLAAVADAATIAGAFGNDTARAAAAIAGAAAGLKMRG